MKTWKKIISRFLSVCIAFLMLICLVLFFKIITSSDVSIGGIRFYYVATNSMYPTIKPYSLMVVKEVDPQTLKEGDVISFVSRDPAIYGMVNTHRILEVTESDGSLAFVTMGDNNPAPDSFLVYPGEVRGKVVFHTPPIKAFTQVLLFAGTQVGFFIVILMPLSGILMMFLLSFLKEMRASLQREMDEIEKLKQSHMSGPISEMSQQEAQEILEAYFGKSLEAVTEEEIRQKLEQLEAVSGKDEADGREESEHTTVREN